MSATGPAPLINTPPPPPPPAWEDVPPLPPLPAVILFCVNRFSKLVYEPWLGKTLSDLQALLTGFSPPVAPAKRPQPQPHSEEEEVVVGEGGSASALVRTCSSYQSKTYSPRH